MAVEVEVKVGWRSALYSELFIELLLCFRLDMVTQGEQVRRGPASRSFLKKINKHTNNCQLWEQNQQGIEIGKN